MTMEAEYLGRLIPETEKYGKVVSAVQFEDKIIVITEYGYVIQLKKDVW